MNKKTISLILFFLIFFFSIFIFTYKDEILDILLNHKDLNTNYITLYIAFSSLYFLTPLPVTIVVILNGYFFKEFGFFISILQITVGSFILKIFSAQIKDIFKINLAYKKVDFSKLSNDNYSIFISRYILPYFFHNVYYGLTKLNSFRFILIIFFSEIPITYTLNEIGRSLTKINSDFSVSAYSIFMDINFYVPFLIIFMLLIFMNYLFKKKK